MVAAGAALAALAFAAAFLAGALAAFLAGAFLTPAAFLAGVLFLVAVVVFLVLRAAFLTGVFFVAVVGLLVEAYMAVKWVSTQHSGTLQQAKLMNFCNQFSTTVPELQRLPRGTARNEICNIKQHLYC